MARAYNLRNPAPPEVRHAKAVKAAAARTSLDHHIAKLVDAAPELTDAQRARLAVLLAPVGGASE